MTNQRAAETTESSVDYDCPPVAELEVEGAQYRVDAGLRGAIAVSTRATGAWSWAFLGEGKWDGVRLKVKALDRNIVLVLEKALREAAEQTD